MAFLLTWATTSSTVRWIQSRSWADQTALKPGRCSVENDDGRRSASSAGATHDALAGFKVKRLEGLVNHGHIILVGHDVIDDRQVDLASIFRFRPFASPLLEPILHRLRPRQQRRLTVVEAFPGFVDVTGQDLGFFLDDGLILLGRDIRPGVQLDFLLGVRDFLGLGSGFGAHGRGTHEVSDDAKKRRKAHGDPEAVLDNLAYDFLHLFHCVLLSHRENRLS